MTDKEKLLNLAARVDQLQREFEAVANDKNTGFFAGHEMMVAVSHLISASRYLMKTAGRFNDN